MSNNWNNTNPFGKSVSQITAGSNVSVGGTNSKPIISATGGGAPFTFLDGGANPYSPQSFTLAVNKVYSLYVSPYAYSQISIYMPPSTTLLNGDTIVLNILGNIYPYITLYCGTFQTYANIRGGATTFVYYNYQWYYASAQPSSSGSFPAY